MTKNRKKKLRRCALQVLVTDGQISKLIGRFKNFQNPLIMSYARQLIKLTLYRFNLNFIHLILIYSYILFHYIRSV